MAKRSYSKIKLGDLLVALGGFDSTPAVQMIGGRPSWKEQRAHFAKLWEQKLSPDAIAARLHRTRGSVLRMRCVFRLPLRQPARPGSGRPRKLRA